MFALLPAVLLAVTGTTVLASPARRATPGPWCDGLGLGSYDSQSNFSLAAYFRDQPNDNITGVPIVLAQADAGVEGEELKLLATYATYPYLDWSTFTLDSGALFGNSDIGNLAEGVTVASGVPPGFITSSIDPPIPSKIYCAAAPQDQTSGFSWLAVNNDADSFSLCQNGLFNVVVYNASAENFSGYDFSTCAPVVLHLVGAF